MGIFREIPPTAGFPLYLKDFLSIFRKSATGGSLDDDFKAYLGSEYAKVVYSGTAALYIILEALKEISPKTTVVIPAYVCPLVPLAIKRAGLKIEVCDTSKDSFDFDGNQLRELCSNNKDILAVVAVHLAGIPVDLDSIKEITQDKDIYVIEDCAQSLGALYKNNKVGTFGDFSFFSLCRGKGLTIYEGGVIVSKRKEYAGLLDRKANELSKGGFFSEALKIFELIGYSVFYRPQLFWFIFKLPQIYWNLRGQRLKALGDYYTVDFSMHNVSGIRRSIGHIAFNRLDEEIEKQRRKADFYIMALKGVTGVKIIEEPRQTKATYPYLTLVFDDPDAKKKAELIFRGKGLGVSQIYDRTITDYDYLKQTVGEKVCPNARYIAEREITLSTSTFLTDADLNSVANAIRNL